MLENVRRDFDIVLIQSECSILRLTILNDFKRYYDRLYSVIDTPYQVKLFRLATA